MARGWLWVGGRAGPGLAPGGWGRPFAYGWLAEGNFSLDPGSQSCWEVLETSLEGSGHMKTGTAGHRAQLRLVATGSGSLLLLLVTGGHKC